MGKREDAMQRREERAVETLAAREGAEAGLSQGWMERLHPRDRRGTFRETMHPARLADPSAPLVSMSKLSDADLAETHSYHRRRAGETEAPQNAHHTRLAMAAAREMQRRKL